MWTVDVEGHEEGILVIQRTVGMDEFCMQHGRLSAFMIVELVLHDWAKGIEHTVFEIEETNPFRKMRLVPIYGRRFQLNDMLYTMEMHPAGVLSPSDEWIDQTWIPHLIDRWKPVLWGKKLIWQKIKWGFVMFLPSMTHYF